MQKWRVTKSNLGKLGNLASLQTLEIAFRLSLFFFYEIWGWERDTRSAFLRVLLFLNLSESPKAKDHQPDLWIYETHLTILWLGLQNALNFLLALATFTQSLKFTSFRLSFQKGFWRKKCRKEYMQKVPESSQCLQEAGELHMQTCSLCCLSQQNMVTFLVGCHYNDDLLISISLLRPQLEHNVYGLCLMLFLGLKKKKLFSSYTKLSLE